MWFSLTLGTTPLNDKTLDRAMQQVFWIDPRDKGAFLVAVMRQLSGDDASMALEMNAEDMAAFDFELIPDLLDGLIPPFTCLWGPAAKAVVLPLTSDTIRPILDQLLPEGRFVHRVGAIQIQKAGELQLLVGDNFHRECVSSGPAIPEEFLQDLAHRGIIRSFKPDSAVRSRRP